jgi:hypothetical protein
MRDKQKKQYDYVCNALLAAGSYPSRSKQGTESMRRILRKLVREAVHSAITARMRGESPQEEAGRIAKELIP